MPFLIGCDYQSLTGWRARKCILVAKAEASQPATREGLLWFQTAAPTRLGRFINPRKIISQAVPG